MIGVAIRNEKRAESSCFNPATVPATMVRPEREKPGISAKTLGDADRQRALPVELVEHADALARDLVAEVEHGAVGDQEEGGDLRA